jgi:hypothetical protein
VAPLTTLVVGTGSAEAELTDADFARWLEYGEGRVLRFDPEASYRNGGLRGLEEDLRSLLNREGVGILVYPIGMEFDFRPTFLQEVLAPIFSVLLVGDDEHYFDVSHRYYAQCFDRVLSTNPLCERYRLYGIEAEFLPGAFNSATYSPPTERRKEIDVSFVGAMRGKVGRQEYAQALLQSRLRFEAFGPGTAAGVLSRPQVVDVFRRSRINLNFTGSSVTTPLDAHLAINRRVRQIKGRCQMIALCGSFVLSEHAAGIEKLFEVGREIDVFHDQGELIDKCRYYLEHDDLREEMAARAHDRAIRDYDLASFGRRLAESLQSRAREKQTGRQPQAIYLDAAFWSGFGAWRFKYIVIFLFSGRLALLARELILLLRTGRCSAHAAAWFAATGLLVAARTSRMAAWLAGAARRVRQSLRRDLEAQYD